MKKLPVALQLWSVRDDFRRDFAGTVAEVAKIGYNGVELAGYGNLDAPKAKAAVISAGLTVAGMHTGIDRLTTDLNGVISEALLFGCKHVICPSWPATHYVTAAACEKIGERLDAIGAMLRSVGLRLSFHNHSPEAQIVDGKTVLDWMLGAAAPRNLSAEVDVYWLHAGGYSPAKFLRENGARCPLIHLKDEKELGLGPVNFDEVFSTIDAVDAVEWLIVEQEAYNHAPLESMRLNFEQLKKWGRV